MKVTTAGAGSRPRVCDLSLAIAELVRSRRAGGALLASALAIGPGTVLAQDQQSDQTLEEVVVTGSRIVRQDFTANSPVQTVDETLFAGPEAGVKYFVKEDTFIYGLVQYQWFFDDLELAEDNADDGGFLYALGIGFTW